eukprot:84802-Pelagomonas_calceolata.AAC.2
MLSLSFSVRPNNHAPLQAGIPLAVPTARGLLVAVLKGTPACGPFEKIHLLVERKKGKKEVLCLLVAAIKGTPSCVSIYKAQLLADLTRAEP